MNLANFINNLLALEGDKPEASAKIEIKYLTSAGSTTPGLTREMELFEGGSCSHSAINITEKTGRGGKSFP